MKWTLKDKKRVKSMLDKNMTYRQIAKELDTSINSIAGIIKRSGFQRHPLVIKVLPPPPPPAPPPPAPPPPSMMLSLEDLTKDTCRAPIDHEGEIKYCGLPVHGKTYCAYHKSKFHIRRASDDPDQTVYRHR